MTGGNQYEDHHAGRALRRSANHGCKQCFQQKPAAMKPEQAEAMKFLMSRSFPGPELLDFEKRIGYMDRNKIDVLPFLNIQPDTDQIYTGDI